MTGFFLIYIAKIASYMGTKIIDVETSMKLDREMEKKLKEEKKKLTRDIIKERVLKMIKEIYNEEPGDKLDKTGERYAREDDLLTKNNEVADFKYQSNLICN